MPLLPTEPLALAALAVIAVGIAFVTRRDVPKAYGLGVVILFVFLLQNASWMFGGAGLIRSLGFQTETLFEGKWWSPVSAMFTHSDLFHVFGNLFILLTAGPALEERIGDRRFLVVYFAAGIGGFLAHVILSFVVPDVVPPEQTAVGASGAIFGVLTTYAVRYPRATLPMIFPAFVFFVVRLPAFVVLLLFLAFNLVYLLGDALGLGGDNVAWWGHFGGFLVGLPFAYTLPKHHEAMPTGTRGLPDPDKLEPLATTPETRRLLAQVRQFRPDARTQHDSTFALAWVDRFLEKARCPTCGAPFERQGLRATCRNGETTIDFARG